MRTLGFVRRFCQVKIPIEAIKRLREETSAPMGECKKALQQSAIDHEKAVLWLKNKGLLTADKRSDKETREGVIASFVTPCRRKAVLLEVNCETDFVAKSDLFLRFVDTLGNRFLSSEEGINVQKTGEEAKQEFKNILEKCEPGNIFPEDSSIKNMNEEMKLVISRLQENIRIRRAITLHSDGCRYGSYIHRAYQQNIGLQACIVQLVENPPVEEQQLEQVINEFADDMATQILGSPPKYLTFQQIPQDLIAEETQKVKQSIASVLQKSPEHIHDKIIAGKLNTSFYSKYLLGCMPYLLSNEGAQVSQYWSDVQSRTQTEISILRSIVWQCK